MKVNVRGKNYLLKCLVCGGFRNDPTTLTRKELNKQRDHLPDANDIQEVTFLEPLGHAHDQY